MRRRTYRFYLLGILAYATATIYLIPYAPRLLPQASAPQTSAAALAELSAVPENAPLTLLVEPRDTVAPLVRAIDGAQKSLDLVIYELQDPEVERALVRAKERGVAVRVLLENMSAFGKHPNQAAHDFLEGEGIAVHWAPGYFPLVHQKTLTIDGVAAYIMTFNLEPQYYASSRDFGVVDTDPSDVMAISRTFQSDWDGKQEMAPAGRDLVWSPGSAGVLLALIAHASSTLEIYNEEMADPRITQALEAAAARGVRVRVVMTYATNWKQAFNDLSEKGVIVRTYASSAKFYIHAKAIIADGNEAFLGSENFSAQSLDKNRELGILLVRPDIIADLQATFERDYQSARLYTVRK